MMDERAVVGLPHPLVDAAGPGWVLHDSRAPVVGLSSGRAALLVDAARSGVRVILRTAPGACLTVPMLDTLHRFGGAWCTVDAGGATVMAVDGRPAPTAQHALLIDDRGMPLDEAAGAALPGPPAPTTRADAVGWRQFSIVLRHPPRAEVRIGRSIEAVADRFPRSAPAAWGSAEPLGLPWDRAAITAAARERMPRETRFFVAGGDAGSLSAVIRIARTADAVIEEARIVVPASDADDADEAGTGVLRDLVARDRPITASLWRLRGAEDLTFVPGLPTAPQPVAILAGPRAVRDLGAGVTRATQLEGARLIGRERTPSLLVELPRTGTIAHLAQMVERIGAEALARQLTPSGLRQEDAA